MPGADEIPFLNQVLAHRIGLDVGCRLRLYRRKCERGRIHIFGEILDQSYLRIGRWECVLVEFGFPRDKIWMNHSFWLWFFHSFGYRFWHSFGRKVDVLGWSCRWGSGGGDGPVQVHRRWLDRVYRRVSQLGTIFVLFSVNFWEILVCLTVISVISVQNGSFWSVQIFRSQKAWSPIKWRVQMAFMISKKAHFPPKRPFSEKTALLKYLVKTNMKKI